MSTLLILSSGLLAALLPTLQASAQAPGTQETPQVAVPASETRTPQAAPTERRNSTRAPARRGDTTAAGTLRRRGPGADDAAEGKSPRHGKDGRKGAKKQAALSKKKQAIVKKKAALTRKKQALTKKVKKLKHQHAQGDRTRRDERRADARRGDGERSPPHAGRRRLSPEGDRPNDSAESHRGPRGGPERRPRDNHRSDRRKRSR